MSFIPGVKKYFTVAEAALVLKIPHGEIYRLLHQQQLKGFKKSGQWIIPRKEIQKYLRKKK